MLNEDKVYGAVLRNPALQREYAYDAEQVLSPATTEVREENPVVEAVSLICRKVKSLGDSDKERKSLYAEVLNLLMDKL